MSVGGARMVGTMFDLVVVVVAAIAVPLVTLRPACARTVNELAYF